MLQRGISTLPRETLDWPLALLSMGWRVHVFVSGAAVTQLPRRHAPPAAIDEHADQYLAWSRLWLAADELGAQWFISAADWLRWGWHRAELSVSPSIIAPAQIRARQAACRHLLNV